MGSATYRVSLSAFEGPFDLLLHLIAKHRLDVHAIPLAQITDDYLAVLRQVDTVDLEVATDFLVVAATLVELKAARLLPDTDDPELEELVLEARDLLYARLLDYRTFKEAAGWVGAALAAGSGYWPRAAALEERFARLQPEVRLPVDAAGLARIAERAFAQQPPDEVDLTHVQPLRLTVREAASLLEGALRRAGGEATFAELTVGCRDRADVVATFLALLELYRADRVDIAQARAFGELRVTDLAAATPAARLDVAVGEDPLVGEDALVGE